MRRYVHFSTLRVHHDVSGYVFTNLGVLYAVLLGFTVVNVQQRFDKLKETSEIEASYLSLLFADAQVFPEKNRLEIQEAIKNYTKVVIEEEWRMMQEGRKSHNAEEAWKRIMKAFYTINPTDNREIAWYNESINKLNAFTNTRLVRLLGANESLGPEMWTLLLIGGLTIVTFVWFFGVENLTLHVLIASILAATTAFLLYLIYSLDTAFSGDVSIPPLAFEKVLSSYF